MLRRPSRGPLGTLGCVGAVAAALTIVLSGCAGEAPDEPPATVVVTVTATPTPTFTPAPPVAADPPAPEPEPAAPVPNAPAPEVVWGPANDTGARSGARAAPQYDGNGAPASYTVIEGDSFFDISQRFELPQQQLLRMNPQIHDFGETIYVGMVINLDWTRTG